MGARRAVRTLPRPDIFITAKGKTAMTERLAYEQQSISTDDRQPDLKVELIRDLDVPHDETDAIAGGNSGTRVVDQTK